MPVERNRLPEIIAELPVAVREALTAAAEAVVQAAQDRVPVASGDLQRAIHIEESAEGVHVVAGDNEAWYGHIVEHGSVNMPAHPFLVPALEEKRTEIEALLVAAIRHAT